MVIGLGSIGRRHARLLIERDDLKVEVCDGSPDTLSRVSQELGISATFDKFEQVLDSQPEMVVIATPHHLHADMTIESLQADIHVLCEKPMSDKLCDAQRMLDAACHSNKILNIGFHLHFHPVLVRLRSLVETGKLGTIASLYARVGTYQTLLNSQSGYQATAPGSLLLDYVHQPDSFYWLLQQKPAGVYMTATKAGNIEPTSDPNAATVLCDYDDAITSTIALNYLQHPERADYEIVGDEGWAHANLIDGSILIGDRRSAATHQETLNTDRDDIYRKEHQSFFDAVDGLRMPESPASDAIVSSAIVEAAMQSWKSGKRVLLSY